MSLKVSFFTDEVDADFAKALRQGKEAGAEAVEIRGRLLGKDVTTLTDEDVATMRRLLEREGMRVAAIGSPFGKCHHHRPEEVERHRALFPRMVALARAFETPIVRGFAFWAVKGQGEPKGRQPLEPFLPAIVEFLKPAVEAAAQAGVILALETEASTMLGNCREAMLVIEALGKPSSLAIAWDVNNALSTGEGPQEGYRRAQGFIRHLHVKPDSQKRLPAFYGDILRWLRADGYQGAASIEHWGSPEAMLSGVRQLRALVDTL